MRQLKITQSVTNRSEKSVDKYFTDISKIPMITQEREVELAQLIREGDNDALQELVQSNLRFVVSVAKQYQNRGLSLPDLINEGNLGLMKAAKRFDETRGFKFISYAVWWVRQSLLQAIADHSRMVRIPLNKVGLENTFHKIVDKLEQELGRRPSDSEIMQAMDVSGKEMNDLLAAMNTAKHKSYDSPIGSDESSVMLDVLVNHDAEAADGILMDESLQWDIQRALEGLSPNEKNVLDDFFGISTRVPKSLEEIGLKMDLTRERVRQIKEKGVRKLKHNGRAKILKKYLAQ